MRRSVIRAAATGSFAIVVASGALACRAGHGGGTNEGPRIDALRPDTVAMPPGSVVEVVIAGRGFAPGLPGMNTIEFGGAKITSVPANAAGSEIRFTVPEALPSVSEAPPQRLSGGTYTVRVITGAGTSNGARLTVVR